MKSEDVSSVSVKALFGENRVRIGEREVFVVLLIPESEWRPLSASWWRGKEACIIGADESGNFFLRHCDGSVRHWDHKLGADLKIATSVRDFITMIG